MHEKMSGKGRELAKDLVESILALKMFIVPPSIGTSKKWIQPLTASPSLPVPSVGPFYFLLAVLSTLVERDSCTRTPCLLDSDCSV